MRSSRELPGTYSAAVRRVEWRAARTMRPRRESATLGCGRLSADLSPGWMCSIVWNSSRPQGRVPAGPAALAGLLPDDLLHAIGGYALPGRLIALPDARDALRLAESLCALANGTGGAVLLGVDLADDDTARVLPGIEEAMSETALRAALTQIDPPIDAITRAQIAETPQGRVGVLQVTMSVNPPHLITSSGRVFAAGAGGVRPIVSRRELDALYGRGRGERERAERLLDAMVDKLMQAHYAFYGLGVAACTRMPSADPFLAGRDRPGGLLAAAPAFGEEWALDPAKTKERPGEIELRGEREVFGYLRLTRAGCAAAGEVRRRPPGEELITLDELRARVERLVELACGALVPAGDAIVPRAYFEGVRGRRFVLGEDGALSDRIGPDTGQVPGPAGDPADPAYRSYLVSALYEGLLRLFGLESVIATPSA